jgi:hypothetical protein
MTTIHITLPDQLATEAQQAGLLTSVTMEKLLRTQLKDRQTAELFQAIERMVAVDVPAVMLPEEVAEEIRLMRAERRNQNSVV